MRKLLFLVSFVLLVVGLSVGTVFAGSDINIRIDGSVVDFPDAKPFYDENGRTQVPVRFLTEKMGAVVDWFDDTQSVVIIKNGNTMKLKIGKNKAEVNSKTVDLDTAAFIKDKRTFVPLRFVVESFDKAVNWDPTNTIDLNTKITNDFFKRPDIEKFIYKGSFYYEGNNIKFNDYLLRPNMLKNYELKTTVNPEISEEADRLIKSLVDDKVFTYTKYIEEQKLDGGIVLPGALKVGIGRGEKFVNNNINYFNYGLFDTGYWYSKKIYNADSFSETPIISLEVNSLWEDTVPDGWSAPYFENKLKSSLIALFGEDNGSQIYIYVLEKYKDKRSKGIKGISLYSSIKETKQFGNIQIDFGNKQGSALYFYFSKNN